MPFGQILQGERLLPRTEHISRCYVLLGVHRNFNVEFHRVNLVCSRFMASASQLKQAIESYQALIANYTLVRERLIARRKGAADHIMVEIDQRLEINARTIDALSRAVESTRGHLEVVEPKNSGH